MTKPNLSPRVYTFLANTLETKLDINKAIIEPQSNPAANKEIIDCQTPNPTIRKSIIVKEKMYFIQSQ